MAGGLADVRLVLGPYHIRNRIRTPALRGDCIGDGDGALEPSADGVAPRLQKRLDVELVSLKSIGRAANWASIIPAHSSAE